MGQSYIVFLGKGGLSYTWQRWKREAIRAAHPYHVIYKELPPTPTPERITMFAMKCIFVSILRTKKVSLDHTFKIALGLLTSFFRTRSSIRNLEVLKNLNTVALILFTGTIQLWSITLLYRQSWKRVSKSLFEENFMELTASGKMRPVLYFRTIGSAVPWPRVYVSV